MKQEVILVLDCGATNVRAIAVNRQGKIVARASTPNASDIAMENNTWHQWSLDAILQRFADCCRQINSELTECHIRGIAVTTFGVDGALVDKQGNLLYPIISWKCPRTAAVMDNIERLISAQRLQAISGVGAFSFNTLYKLVWLKENHPQLLERAHDMHAIIYYDPNFRSSHKEEAIKLAPTIIENLEYANIVRGSQEDFFYMWGLQEADKIYKDKVKFYCRNFLCTAGAEQVSLRTGTISKEYSIPPLEAVSTIGAGDNFNAGIIYGLLKYDVRYDDLNTIGEAKWDQIIRYGMEFAAEVCKSYSNSVSNEFAERCKY